MKVTMSECKGQFIPDLLLMQTSAFDPDELKKIWIYVSEVLDGRKRQTHKFHIDTIAATVAWIHEFAHFLQFTTTVKGIEYYSLTSQLSDASIECFKTLMPWSIQTGNLCGLPLDNLVTVFSKKNIDCPPLQRWYEKYFEIQTLLALGAWTIRPSLDTPRLQRLPVTGSPTVFPSITFKQGETAVEQIIDSKVVLETGAFTLETQFLQFCFPDESTQVIEILHGDFTEDTRLAVSLMIEGMGNLIPLLVDFSMQASLYMQFDDSQNIRDYQDRSLSWRFVNGLEALRIYAGSTPDDVYKHYKEITEKLTSTLSTLDTDEEINWTLSQLDSDSLIADAALRKLLCFNLMARRDHKRRFMTPALWQDFIASSVRLPRVLFNHAGVPDDYAIAEIGFGPKLHTSHEMASLLVGCSKRWLGRQLVTREGAFVCPNCQIIDRRGSCTGRCLFSHVCKALLNINPSELAQNLMEVTVSYEQ